MTKAAKSKKTAKPKPDPHILVSYPHGGARHVLTYKGCPKRWVLCPAHRSQQIPVSEWAKLKTDHKVKRLLKLGEIKERGA